MRFYFSSYDFVGITCRLEELGHEVVSAGRWGDGIAAQPDSWWGWMLHGHSAKAFGDYMVDRVKELAADVVVIGKGYHWVNGRPWFILPATLRKLKRLGCTLVYLSWDDPDHVGPACASGMMDWMDVVGTCCPDEERSVAHYRRRNRRARIFPFWPGWDQVSWEPTIGERVEETCDLLIGGTPYVKPNTEYAGPARRDIALAALAEGWTVELWGGTGWCREEGGGHPSLEPHYRGHYGYRERGRLWRRARVNVDVHLRAPVPLYLNDRFFMLGGCGRAFACDLQPGVDSYFPEPAYYVPGDLGDLMEKLRWLMEHPTNRNMLGLSMRDRILKDHTLAHRADAMLEAIG